MLLLLPLLVAAIGLVCFFVFLGRLSTSEKRLRDSMEATDRNYEDIISNLKEQIVLREDNAARYQNAYAVANDKIQQLAKALEIEQKLYRALSDQFTEEYLKYTITPISNQADYEATLNRCGHLWDRALTDPRVSDTLEVLLVLLSEYERTMDLMSKNPIEAPPKKAKPTPAKKPKGKSAKSKK